MSPSSGSSHRSENDLISASQRIDRWLWFARFLKSRTQAASLVVSGKIRVNGERVTKASHMVRSGDVLTFPLGPHIRMIRVLAPGERRGPAPEARLLYDDMSPAQVETPAGAGRISRDRGEGRPTKKDRRRTDALKGFHDV